MKYCDLLTKWLIEEGYTTCFFVAGGNIMHILESFRKNMKCIPVVHEVAAGIATEYFNASSQNGEKALSLVTAGPGLTNIVTAIGGAWLESRELLVIGGQVKTADLSHNTIRQRGIQEISGADIVRPIAIESFLMEAVQDEVSFKQLCRKSWLRRAGPVFIELPLDIQGQDVEPDQIESADIQPQVDVMPCIEEEVLIDLASSMNKSERPVMLLGAGINRETAVELAKIAESRSIPLFTTWNGADRIPSEHPCYFGRPNTWGQRYSNLLLQQSDFIVVLGSRLGLQQTGFNWQAFSKNAYLVQVDIDPTELAKGHPDVSLGVCADANDLALRLAAKLTVDWKRWLSYCEIVKAELPLVEDINNTGDAYLSPHQFVRTLSEIARNDDIIIPCSSGSAFTIMMQVFDQKAGQRMITNKGLASMGYGLSGAIGAAIANPDKRTILVEGDGGFSQNLQEVGTVAVNQLNLKMFIFDDSGYASIRMTQKNYFDGHYVGCDLETGLGLPDWEKLFHAYNVHVMCLNKDKLENHQFNELFNADGPAAFIVKIDPEQTYFPKITSRVTPTGMESNPLHIMTPELSDEKIRIVGKYL